MPRRFRPPVVALAAALALLAPLSPAAQEAAPMSEDARAALRAEIRAYLLDNPEVIFEAVAEFERRTAAAQADMDGALVEINADDIFADAASWSGGNPDGDLVLVEFMDYRCSFCRRAFPQMMDFTQADGNVRLVIKELPILGPQSEMLSRFAVAVLQLAGDEAYFAAHELLLETRDDPTDAGLLALAAELGLDGPAVLERMRAPEVTAVLSRNRALAQRLQISGTPSFVMGDGDSGEMLRGMVPTQQLHQLAASLRN